MERWKEIGKFIDTVEAGFPISLVLAANYRKDGELEEGDARWTVERGAWQNRAQNLRSTQDDEDLTRTESVGQMQRGF